MTTSSISVSRKLFLISLFLLILYLAKTVLIPLSIGGVLATLFLPLCKWMEKEKLPRALAAFMCLIVLVGIIAGIFTLLGWQVSGLTNDFEIIRTRTVEMGLSIQKFFLDHLGISMEKQDKLLTTQLPLFSRIIQNIAGSLSAVLTDFVLILVYVLFILYYRGHIKQFLLKFSSHSQRQEMERIIYRVAHVSQQYLLGLSKMIVCLWIMYGIGFASIGVKNALFFAVLCGLLEIIPFIGNITGTSITIFVAMVQGAGFPTLVGIAIVYGVIQFIQGWILEPLIVGPQVKINPLSTIIALVLGNFIWGLPGIFLAIPLIAMFKIVSDHIEFLKPYGFLIGEVKHTGRSSRVKWWKHKTQKAA